jgi:hypothetical protein
VNNLSLAPLLQKYTQQLLPYYKDWQFELSEVLSFTQQNEADLYSVGTVPLTLATTVGRKHTNRVQNMILYHCMTFSPLVAICYVLLL